MKNIQRFSLFLLLSLVFMGCDKDEDVIQEKKNPDVEFAFNPETPTAGEEVVFTANSLTGSSEISTWSWDFGDNGTSTGMETTYSFEESGSYTVVLTASDIEGTSIEVSKDITVSEKPFQATIAWSFSNGTKVNKINDASAPAIDDAGIIYYSEGSAGGNTKLVAVMGNETEAQKKWESSLGFDMRNAPAIGPNGNIYVGLWTGKESLVKIDGETGENLWGASTNGGLSNSTAAIDSDGNVYIGSYRAGAYAFDSDGELLWNHDPEGVRYYSSPVLSADESTLYISMVNGGELRAISTADGSLKWNEPVAISDSGMGTSLSLDSDGTVYVTTGTQAVAITDNGDTGSIKWTSDLEGPNASGVVIGPEGDLYVGTESGLVSLNPADGAMQWIYKTDHAIKESVPAVDSNGNIYVGSIEGEFHIVSPDGEALKIIDLGDNIVNSPTIADNGSVYVEAKDGDQILLYKIIVENSTGPADSPWPMKGQNRKHTSQGI